MGILNLKDISFHYTGEMIIENITFEIEKNEKIGLIGLNGCGKTTLFKLICKELLPTSGDIYTAKDIDIGHLRQEGLKDPDKTVYLEAIEAFADLISIENQLDELSDKISNEKNEEILIGLVHQQSALNDRFIASGGLTFESRTKAILKGLGFLETQFALSCDKLSGGQKTRLALAKLLLRKPDLLLLDEPTNHLDFDSIYWLESYLKEYNGSIMIISHDRYFLDVVTDKTIEIENKTAVVLKGNYTQSRELKRQLREAYEKAYGKQRSEISHLNDVIKKLKQFNREKSVKRARSFEKKLNKIDELGRPLSESKKIKLEFSKDITESKDILHIHGLSKRYGKTILFSDLSLDLFRKDHLFVIGPNGSGKSTLLKILIEKIDKDSGTFKIGKNISVGYYDQEHAFDDPSKSLYDEIYYEFPYMNQTQIRNSLASMLFTGTDHEKTIGQLSGGEKSKMSLLKLMLSSPDFLILDEPTNHLDIYSREKLEEALIDYEGTMLIVSHDRYFIRKLGTKILVIAHGTCSLYNSDFDEYLQKVSILNGTSSDEKKPSSDSRLTYEEMKKRSAIVRKLRSDINRIEKTIAEKDILLHVLQNDIIKANEAADFQSLHELSKRKDDFESEYILELEKLHELKEMSKEIEK